MAPNDLIEILMDENPDTTEQELRRLIKNALKDDPDALEAVIKEVFADLWKQTRFH